MNLINIVLTLAFVLFALFMMITGSLYIILKAKNPDMPNKLYLAGFLSITVGVLNLIVAYTTAYLVKIP